MSDTVFCYHCRVRHPIDKVRKFSTRSGKRWRCIKSIAATRNGLSEREEFGRQTTAFNTAMAEIRKSATVPLCLQERDPLAHRLQLTELT